MSCLCITRIQKKTLKAFECGWFHSGDIAAIYREGYFEIVDRKKDMIKTCARTSPAERLRK